MKGGIPSFDTARALTNPIVRPTDSPAASANGKETSALSSLALITPTRAATAPTDRSIPAMTMVQSTPNARMAEIDTCRIRFRMFSREMKIDVATAKKIQRAIVIRIRNVSNGNRWVGREGGLLMSSLVLFLTLAVFVILTTSRGENKERMITVASLRLNQITAYPDRNGEN